MKKLKMSRKIGFSKDTMVVEIGESGYLFVSLLTEGIELKSIQSVFTPAQRKKLAKFLGEK